MQPRVVLAESSTPDGEPLRLVARGDAFEVLLGGDLLMSSRTHDSEEQLAEVACGAAPQTDARVLVGGLGMGFTLRAVLDCLGPAATVVVAELLPEIVAWNRGPLAHLADAPLEDPRVRLEVADVLDVAARGRHLFDGIVLDVDNGPEPFTVSSNARLYAQPGLRVLRDALRPGGALVVWSAFGSPAFLCELAAAGFRARPIRTRARPGKGSHHVVFVARR